MWLPERSISKCAAATTLVAALCLGCASVGTPDGGRFDDIPPVFVGSSPERNATEVRPRSVSLDFNEIVRIENAAEKVVVSPPMVSPPDIQVNNRRINIKFNDSLRANTTYSIDFADAIVDNNEGNPLGDFCFSFSTGEQLDTLELSGYVLDASNLEPIKGMLVGIYSDLEDSAFVSKPFERISHTDSEGHFVLRGVGPGRYRIFALNDMDQNYYFSQKSEMLAWNDSLVIPDSEQRFRDDTIRNPKGEVDSIRLVQYTRFMPDDIVLRAFTEKPVLQYLSDRSRKSHEKFNLTFAIPLDTLPTLKGLNFDQDGAFHIERSAGNDTLTYWMHDSLIYYMDTLRFSLTYPVLDSTGVTVDHCDTLSLVPPKSRQKVLQDAARKAEEEAKERERELRRLERQGDSLGIARLFRPQVQYLSTDVVNISDVDKVLTIEFKEPVQPFIPDSVIHVRHKVDSIYEPMRMVLLQDSFNIRLFRLYAEWRPEQEYSVTIDSAGIRSIYGLPVRRIEESLRFKAVDQYSTFTVKVARPKPGYIVQLYTGKDKVVRSQRLEGGSAVFYFLTPGKYYVRMFDDVNGNGLWDTGDYASKRQPEAMYYLNKVFELKQNWDHETEPWNVTDEPLFRQKPDDAKTQKSEARKERKSKNIERDERIAKEKAQKQKRKEERRASRKRSRAK